MWRFLINSAQLVLGWPTITSDCGDLGAIPSSYISSLPLSSVSLQELHTQSLPCSVPIPGLSAFAIGPYLQCVHSHSGSPVVNFWGCLFLFTSQTVSQLGKRKDLLFRNAVLWWKSTGFSAEPKWRSFSVENKQNPLIYGTSFIFSLKATHLRHGHHARAHGIIAWTGHVFLYGAGSWGKAV